MKTPRMAEKNITEIKAGDSVQLVVTITENLVKDFAKFSGDYNPLHLDEGYAKQTIFGGRVAHGMILGSFISQLIGMELPGAGALWLSQQLEFLLAVRIGDKITVVATVASKSESQSLLTLKIIATNQQNFEVLRGESKVKLMQKETKVKSKPLNECRVLVTGASRGLGAAIASEFAKQGAEVIINYRSSQEAAEKLCSEILSLGGRAISAQADVTQGSSVELLTQTIGSKGVDILIFNAIDNFKQVPLLEQSLEDFEHGLNYGMRAPFSLLKTFLPGMIERQFGRIVSVLSVASFGTPPVGYSSYNVNKKALEAITRSVAVEYGRFNITANMVSPNMLRTDLTAGMGERVKQLVEAQTPLKRLADLQEVASNIVFLCRPESSYINGHNLVISGGSLMV